MAHWTYQPFDAKSDLDQGDIIARTDQVLDLLTRVHKHFCDEKYLGFLVVTQSCDLVRHNGRCKTQYLNLAAIRSLESVIPSILDDVCGTGYERVFEAEKRDKASEALDRLLNQNEQALGLFYLHPDEGAGIAVPAVAMLRVTIAIRIQHYSMLCEARRGRLTPQFSSKLGWLSGNLYSRVATPDWNETKTLKTEITKIIRQLLDSGDYGWVPKSCVKEAGRANLDIASLELREAVAELKKLAPRPPKEKALDKITAITTDVIAEAKNVALAQLGRRLKAEPTSQSADLSIVSATLETVLREAEESMVKKIAMRLRNDPEFTSYCRDS